MSGDKKTRPDAATSERASGKAGSDSKTNCTTENPAGQPKISDFLGLGPEEGLTIHDLERITGRKGREIRLKIQQERLHGVPILADNKSGYFLPRNELEKQLFVAQMYHRATEIEKAARAVFAAEVGRFSADQRTAQQRLSDDLAAQCRIDGV